MSNKAGKVFAKNLVNLMGARPDLDTQVKVAARSGIAQTTVGRILKGMVSPTLDNVEAISNAFGKNVGDLIDSTYDVGRDISYDRVAYAKLPKEEKARIESYIEHVIKEYAADSAKEFNKTSRTPITTSAKTQGRQEEVFETNEKTTVARGVKRRHAV